jgi:phage terminase large subunit-like protein
MVVKKEDLESKLILDSARNDLMSYMMVMHSHVRATRFTEALCHEVQRVLEGRCDRLIITAPPRHGKTMVVSENAPSFFLGKFPTKKIIMASHTDQLATDLGTKVKNNLLNPMHGAIFGEHSMASRHKSANHNLRTNAGGEFLAVGLGTSPIGRGANLYIIDDPVRGLMDVDSETKRHFYKQWYSSAVLSRLEGQGGIVLLHQRWHPQDLAGQLLEEEGSRWRVVNFPAVIETEEDKSRDYLNRDIGEVLVPELHDYAKLMDLKSTMLHSHFQAMYQGAPIQSIGQEFVPSMLQTFEQSPDQMARGMNVYILVDPASSSSTTADNTAMAVVGLSEDGNYYLLDLVAEKLDLKGRVEKLFELHRRWRPLGVYYEKFGAQSDIEHIQYVMGNENYRFPIHQLSNTVKNRKIDAIRRLIPDMLNGRWWTPHQDSLKRVNSSGEVYHPIKVMLDEMVPFPYAKHDDCLDAVSRIYDIPVHWPNSNGSSRRDLRPKISPW